jgi:hypothetical protein
MQHTMIGRGPVTAKAGRTQADYLLETVRPERIGSLPDMVGGSVLPVSGEKDEILTLETENGLTVKFSYLPLGRNAKGIADSKGEILVHGVTPK